MARALEFFEGTKQILRYLNVYTRPPVNLGFAQMSSHFIEYFAVISIIITSIPIGVFCYVNRNDFQASSPGVLYFIANNSITIIYLTLLDERSRIIEAIDSLEQLLINRIHLNEKMMKVLTQREEDNNKLAQTLLRSGVYTVLFFFVPNALPSILHIIFGWIEDVPMEFPFPVIVPFKTKKYSGFFVELCIQMFTVHFYMLIVSSTISLFYSFYMFIEGLLTDFAEAEKKFQQLIFENQEQKNPHKAIHIELETKRFLKESIDLHAAILKARDDLQVIMSGTLFFELFTYVAFLAINVFIFDHALSEDGLNNFTIFLSLNNRLIQTVFCYVLCNLATKIAFTVDTMDTLIYDFMWYTYPVDDQKFIAFMIQRAHCNFRFTGYGIINGNLATFLSLTRTAFSYYLILRKG